MSDIAISTLGGVIIALINLMKVLIKHPVMVRLEIIKSLPNREVFFRSEIHP